MNINPSKKIYKSIFGVTALVILTLMLIMSQDAGISGDEYFHVDHAEKVYSYYQTFGEDTVATTNWKGKLNFYGQSLDNEIHIFNELFNIENIYQSRHFFIALTGWILVLFCGLIAHLLFGWKAGLIAMLFAFFSPKLLGHSFNNPKDLPFATAYIFTIYFILKLIKELPRFKVSSLIFTALGIAWAISLRIGGVILVPYLFMFVGLYYLSEKKFYTKPGFIGSLINIGILLLVAIAGYFIGLILWPYALENPINNPIASLKEMTNYGTSINQLFNGKIELSANLPWHYGLTYILITNPIVVFIGVILFFISLFFRKVSKNDYLFYFYLIFAFAFPVAYIIYKHSNLYGGWRHLLWTYSPIVILSAGGFDFLLRKNNKYIKFATIALIALLLFHPIRHTFKNHPHQYVYYNQLVGGVKGAYGEYEMDYYYHSLRDGAEWLIENELNSDSTVIATNHGRIAEYYFRNYPTVKVKYCRYYEKSRNNWDYAIWANTHITPEQLTNGLWPPKETIYTMDVDGVPIGAVVKRISYEDYKGFDALNKQKPKEAKQHFKNFLAVYPKNEEVFEGYCRAMLMERQYDSTIIYADSAIYFNPRQIRAHILKASALNTQKKYKEALIASNKMLAFKEDIAEGHFQKGIALKYLKQPNEALKAFQKAATLKKEYYLAFMQMGEILSNYKNFKKAINIYSKVLKFKKNDLKATIRSAKCYYLLNDKKNTQKLLSSIPERSQNNIEVVMLKCRMAMNNKDWNSAGRYLNMARNINNNSELFVLRAQYVMMQKNNKLAKQFIAKAIDLDSTNREAKEIQKTFAKTAQTVNSTNKTQTTPETQQSIMYQKPNTAKKKNAPITFPDN